MKLVIGVLVAAVFVAGAFYAGWNLRGSDMKPVDQKSATSTVPTTKEKQSTDAGAGQSNEFYTVTLQGDVKNVSSAYYRVAFDMSKDWAIDHAVPAQKSLSVISPEGDFNFTKIRFERPTSGALSDFIDGTSRGFAAVLGLSNGQKVTLGATTCVKIKNQTISGYESAMVTCRTEEGRDAPPADITWIRHEGLNWYIVVGNFNPDNNAKIDRVLASLKLK